MQPQKAPNEKGERASHALFGARQIDADWKGTAKAPSNRNKPKITKQIKSCGRKSCDRPRGMSRWENIRILEKRARAGGPVVGWISFAFQTDTA